jgi:hypothetical protein
MLRRSRTRIGIAIAALAVALTGTAAAGPEPSPQALPLPSPARFVANLDLECFRTSEYTPPPLPAPITLSHLNPVLAAQGRWSVQSLGPRTELCTPVAKNNVIPPAGVLEFVRFVDLSCYRIPGPVMQVPLNLRQLNPVLSSLPTRNVVTANPETLCLPVIKNTSVPPPEVLELVKYIDLVCYRESPQVPMNKQLQLTQLNPVLAHIPPTTVLVNANRQLCVPMRKDNQQIPERVLNIVKWIDLEKWDISAPTMPAFSLRLRHINPLMEHLPAEPATLFGRMSLALPVAKNGMLPPTTG